MDKETTPTAEAGNTLPIHPDDPDDEWVTAVNSGRTVRVRALTGGLVLVAVLAGGFWGGVVAEKHHGAGTPASSSLAGRFAAARAAAGAGAAGLPSSGAGFTTGTVINVTPKEIDISDASGSIVKITVGPSTTVTRTARSSPGSLQIGDTVVATGAAGSAGSFAATAVRATAQGVGGGGGFGAGGLGTGGFGTRGGGAGGGGAGGGGGSGG